MSIACKAPKPMEPPRKEDSILPGESQRSLATIPSNENPHGTVNILFINYGDLRSNSMGHIKPYAQELQRRGHACAIAVENEPREARCEDPDSPCAMLSHAELESAATLFPNGKPADILHAWTPRENVRALSLAYRENHPETRLVIHLEDNEEAILESYYQKCIEELRAATRPEVDTPWHPRLSHPIEYRRFLAHADAVTLITPSLIKLLPIPKETLVINPIVETNETKDAPAGDTDIRAAHGLPADKKLIVFPGGITSNNRDDIRNLYLAVHHLQQKGVPLLIVKTGPSCSVFEQSFAFDREEVAIDLGYIEADHVSTLIRISELLVQPGQDNRFNRDRLPCKIPEFLASGRPSILPEFYLPTNQPKDSIALGLKTSSPEEIAQRVEELLADPQKGERLAQRAQAYAHDTFDAQRNGEALERLYKLTARRERRATEPLPILPGELQLQNSHLKQEIDTLNSWNVSLDTRLQAELKKTYALAEDIEELTSKLEQSKQLEERRRRSFSWQVTAPLRTLRRGLFDPLKRQPRPPANTSASEPNESVIEPKEAEQAPEPHVFAPPPDHRCYVKNYHKFVEREEWLRSIYLDKYKHPAPGPESPKVSILLPVYNVEEKWLRNCIESVKNQVYQNWELCIADDASTAPRIAPVLREYEESDSRVKLVFRRVNGHISAASNSAYELATGDYIALLDHDDELPPHALARMVDAISQNPHAKLFYSDEDKIDEHGIRHDPHFKSDWNYDLLLGCNMISHFGVYRRDAYETAGGFRLGFEGAQDWDLALRVIENCRNADIIHIPEVLYHWRAIESSTARHYSAKNYAHEAQRRAIAEHLERKSRAADLISIDGVHWRVRYQRAQPEPKVALVIPSKDWYNLISKCVDSILDKTTYQNYEIVIVDNNSTEPESIRYLSRISEDSRVSIRKYNKPFNYSALNNYAISKIPADIICLLNNDTEVIDADWLSELVSHAIRPEVGVVAAKLLYPDDHIQHAGLILGVDGVAKHAFRFLHRNDSGHVHRASLISQWSAVTGACMAFRKEVWEQLGGLDEENLAIAYNDVDFCLKARSAGLSVLHTPFALLYHHESATRGYDQTPEQLALFHSEAAYMYRRWPEQIARDPFYNPNFSKKSQDFAYLT